jgi:hypothetical protein
MFGVLYYGKTCHHSQQLLLQVAKQGISDKLRFVPVDQQVRRGDQLMAILDNGSQVLVPPGVTAVPALLDIRDKNIYMGPEVGKRLAAEAERAARAATGAEKEPMAYTDISSGTSTTFSFVGDDPEALLAKGTGRTDVPSHYAGIHDNPKIPTTQEEGSGGAEGKVTSADYDAYIAQRDAGIEMPAAPPAGAGPPPPQKV